MKPRSGTGHNFLLGIWLGGSLVLWGVVGYNFAGISHILDGHSELAERTGLDPDHEDFKTTVKTSNIWVFSSELNRAFFRWWGWVQLWFAMMTLLCSVVLRQGLWCPVLIAAAGGLVVYSTFVQIPEITEVGRSLDFVPRDPPPPQLEKFQSLHRMSLYTDFARGVLIFLAGVCVSWRSRPKAEPDV